MKLLTLARHGRAQWKDSAYADFDRPLDRRGVQEAQEMARRVAEEALPPECILASAAQRTRETAAIFARVLALGERRVICEERLYLAPPAELLAVVRALGPQITHALLVGHNPGLSELARLLAPDAGIGDLPTGAFCRVALAAPEWGAVAAGGGQRAALEVPRRRFDLWS